MFFFGLHNDIDASNLRVEVLLKMMYGQTLYTRTLIHSVEGQVNRLSMNVTCRIYVIRFFISIITQTKTRIILV